MMPAWVDEYLPFVGACGICGGDDSRHRTIDAMCERVRAGERLDIVADDYGVSVVFIVRAMAQGLDDANA